MTTQTYMALSAFQDDIEAGPYAWPGGYPRYFAMADGGALSFAAAIAERERIESAIKQTADDSSWFGANAQWLPVSCEVNYEDSDLVCDHTGERIESAYGDANMPTFNSADLLDCANGHHSIDEATGCCTVCGWDETPNGAYEPADISPPRVWIVEGEHFSVLGLRISVHASKAGADAKALEIARELIAEFIKEWADDLGENDIKIPSEVTDDNWESALEALNDLGWVSTFGVTTSSHTLEA